MLVVKVGSEGWEGEKVGVEGGVSNWEREEMV